MKSQVLYTVWCNLSGETVGEILHRSLLGAKGLTQTFAYITYRNLAVRKIMEAMRVRTSQSTLEVNHRRYMYLDVTFVGQRSSPLLCNLMIVKIKFHLGYKLRSSCAQLLLWKMHLSHGMIPYFRGVPSIGMRSDFARRRSFCRPWNVRWPPEAITRRKWWRAAKIWSTRDTTPRTTSRRAWRPSTTSGRTCTTSPPTARRRSRRTCNCSSSSPSTTTSCRGWTWWNGSWPTTTSATTRPARTPCWRNTRWAMGVGTTLGWVVVVMVMVMVAMVMMMIIYYGGGGDHDDDDDDHILLWWWSWWSW